MRLRKGLLALYRNCVLLRDPESPGFFPVRLPACLPPVHGTCVCD